MRQVIAVLRSVDGFKLARQRGELSRQRRALLWARVERNQVFDGPGAA